MNGVTNSFFAEKLVIAKVDFQFYIFLICCKFVSSKMSNRFLKYIIDLNYIRKILITNYVNTVTRTS
jgi:hypothetical protein